MPKKPDLQLVVTVRRKVMCVLAIIRGGGVVSFVQVVINDFVEMLRSRQVVFEVVDVEDFP